jgi:hypothetical protein
MKKLFSLLLLGICLLPTMSFTNYEDKSELLEIADVLQEIESNNNPKAIGDGGLALGALQIHDVAIQDVNHNYGTGYTHQDAMDPLISRDVFVLYSTLNIKRYRKRCGNLPNDYDIVRMWNGGPLGYEKDATIPYLLKYKRYLNQV